MSSDQRCRVYVGNLSWRVKWQDLKDHCRKVGDVNRVDVFEDSQGRSRGCGIVEYATPEGAKRAIEELTDSQLFDRMIFVREDRERSGGQRPDRNNNNNNNNNGNYNNNNNNNRMYNDRGRRYDRGGRGGYGSPRRDYRYNDYNDGYMNGGPRRGGYDRGRNDRYNDRNNYYRNNNYDASKQIFVSNIPWRCSWQDLKDLFRDAGLEVNRVDILTLPDGKSKGVATVLFATSEEAKSAIDKFNDYELAGRRLLVRMDRDAPQE